jgi:hypothetical protein
MIILDARSPWTLALSTAFGTMMPRSRPLSMPLSSRSSVENVCTDIGVCCRFVATRVAVTTISSSAGAVSVETVWAWTFVDNAATAASNPAPPLRNELMDRTL